MQDNQKDDRWYSTVATEAVAPNATAPHALGKTYDVTETYTTDEKRTSIISVLLVDDHALMREGLRRLLELEEDIQIVGEAIDGFDALQKIRQLSPEVVLMDISLPMMDASASSGSSSGGGNGFSLCWRLRFAMAERPVRRNCSPC